MEQAIIRYWQCPQDPEHVFDWDDWRVLPDEDSIGWRGTVARCPYDHRDLRREVSQ